MMSMFSDNVVEVAKRLGKLDDLKRIETLHGDHEQFYIYKTSLSEELVDCTEPKKLFGYNGVINVCWSRYATYKCNQWT